MAHVGVPKVLFMSSLWIYKDCVCWWVSKRKHTLVTLGWAQHLCVHCSTAKDSWVFNSPLSAEWEPPGKQVHVRSSACSETSEHLVFLNACLNTKVRRHLLVLQQTMDVMTPPTKKSQCWHRASLGWKNKCSQGRWRGVVCLLPLHAHTTKNWAVGQIQSSVWRGRSAQSVRAGQGGTTATVQWK